MIRLRSERVFFRIHALLYLIPVDILIVERYVGTGRRGGICAVIFRNDVRRGVIVVKADFHHLFGGHIRIYAPCGGRFGRAHVAHGRYQIFQIVRALRACRKKHACSYCRRNHQGDEHEFLTPFHIFPLNKRRFIVGAFSPAFVISLTKSSRKCSFSLAADGQLMRLCLSPLSLLLL